MDIITKKLYLAPSAMVLGMSLEHIICNSVERVSYGDEEEYAWE